MNIFFQLILLINSTAWASSPMQFSYVPNEGPRLDCVHEKIRDLPDWKVICGNGEKEFTAHVILRQRHKDSEPQTGLELLYWVTAPGETPTSVKKYHSTTALLHMKGKAEVSRFVIFQGVENDQASLRLEVGN